MKREAEMRSSESFCYRWIKIEMLRWELELAIYWSELEREDEWPVGLDWIGPCKPDHLLKVSVWRSI